MGYARKSVSSGYPARVSACRSARRHVAAAGAFAGAGILALGLVTAPPGTNAVRTDVRTLQLSTFVLPLRAPLHGILVNFAGSQPQTAAPVASDVPDGAADIITAAVAKPNTFGSAVDEVLDPADPATNRQLVNTNAVALAAPTDAFDLGAIFGPLLNNPIIGPIVGGLLLFGPVIVLVILACLPCAVFNVVSTLISGFLADLTPLPAFQALSVAADEATAAPTLALPSDPPSGDPAPFKAATAGLADVVPAGKTGHAEVSPPVTLTDPPTETARVNSTALAVTSGADETSTDTAKSMTEAAEKMGADETATESTTVSAPEPPASDSISEPAKPTGRPETPRPVVRPSLKAGEPHPSSDGHSTTGAAAAGDGPTKAGSSAAESSSTASSPAGSKSRGGDSSGGDAGDS